MIEKVAEGKALSGEVIEQIRAKTDGVPLFVEELTKSVIESVRVSREHSMPYPYELAFLQHYKKHYWPGSIVYLLHDKLPNSGQRWDESSPMNCCTRLPR